MSLKTIKFSRAANFNNYEEELLIALVKKYKHIIECKATDGSSTREKNAAWNALAKEFNSTSGGQFRAIEILRRKYDNIKKRAKQKYADEKARCLGTGGGPFQSSDITKVDADIKELLGPTMTGFQSQFDDDNDLDLSIDIPPVDDTSNRSPDVDVELSNEYEIISITGPESEPRPSTSNENLNWSKYTPKMLHTKKSDALQHKCKEGKRGKALEQKLSTWTTGKLELVELQKQCLLEEHRQKLDHAKEKHERAIQREDRESEAKIKALNEEQKLQMEILALQKQKYI